MNSEDWARLRAVLERVLEAPEAERTALLEAECRRTGVPEEMLRELLASDESSSEFLEPPSDTVAFEKIWRELGSR